MWSAQGMNAGKNDKHLPDQFSLEEIKPWLTDEQIIAIQKIHTLWFAGIPLQIYGSFVAQCGMLLLGNKTINARDIDAASALMNKNDIPAITAKLKTLGFHKKNIE